MIETVAETGSTNADLIARLREAEFLADGFWLRADRQSGGRGRSGRQWISPPGNIYASTVVNLARTDPPAHTLSLVAGLAVLTFVREALDEEQNDSVMLKWPNDVLVNGAKIAGILLERHQDTIVIGIGVNCAHAPDVAGRTTACLAGLGSTSASNTAALMERLAQCFAQELRKWREFGMEPLLSRWSAFAHPVGTAITVHDPGGEVLSGTFAGLDRSGSLLLRMPDGNTRTVHAGDVAID